MKVLKIDRFRSTAEIMPETRDDLWHLSHIIEHGDLVKGRTTRKIKGGEGETTRRENLFLEIEVKGVDFDKFSGLLRVQGIIRSGKPEDLIEIGAMHSLEIEQNRKLHLQKKKFRKDQYERLQKAQKASHKKPVLVVVLDDESASFALMKEFGFEEKGSIHSGKAGKQFDEGEWKKEFYGNIAKTVMDSGTDIAVLAGPGFAKNELQEVLKEKKFPGKIFVEGTNATGLTGVNELLKGTALAKIVEDAEITKEAALIEKVMEAIGKNTGKATYGLEEVGKAIDLGAVESLLVLDKYLGEEREKLSPLLETAESLRAEIHIFNSEHDPGKKLEGIGKIAAVLRYRIE
ncbi:MAG: mRNA surveillance protein pelota [Candidatus Diapherotrites archaeon]|nr:mRNA surveillance protein pelota [Candidatus Diapherotrites archaeon]